MKSRWVQRPDPSPIELASQARSLAVFFAAGSTLALATLVVPHGREHVGLLALVACLGYPGAGFVYLFRDSLRAWAPPLLLAVGTLVATGGVALGDHAGLSAAGAFFYVWVALLAFQHFDRRLAWAEIGFAGACYGTVLLVERIPSGAGEWLLAMGTAVVAGVVTGGTSRRLRLTARTDTLTGLPNRRAFMEDLAREMADARRSQSPLSVAALDLDGFKAINDRLGHQEGDRVLAAAASAWAERLRPRDRIGRLGGDEFAVVLPGAAGAEAREVIDRLRGAGFACSAGVAELTRADDAPGLLARADAELYRDKRRLPAHRARSLVRGG